MQTGPPITNSAPPAINLTGGALGLPAPGEEEEWAEKNFLPPQRKLAAWLRAGDFPSGTAKLPNLFPQNNTPLTGKTISLDTPDEPLWIIGDMHGDFLSLLLSLNLAHTYDHTLPAHRGGLPADAPSNLFFLGDFIDEGPHSAEIMAWLLATCADRAPGARRFTIKALVGNHDDALDYDENLLGFWTSVSPSNFFLQLNNAPAHELATAFGKSVRAFFRDLPRMALLNNNVLAVHGGVPRPELTSAIRNPADLETPGALDDFTWARLLEDRPRGIPGQHNKNGSLLGYEDFDRFIEVFARVTGAAPRLLLRGHDHKPRNCKWLDHYENCRVLTLNNFTVNDRGARGGARCRPLTLARLNRPRTAPLDIHLFQLDLPPSLIEHCRHLPSILETTPPP